MPDPDHNGIRIAVVVDKNYMFRLSENVSTYGEDIDFIIRFISVSFGILTILAEGVLLYFVVRYRRRPNQTAAYQPGTSPKALLWIFVPITLILILDIGIDLAQAPVWNRIKIFLPQNPDQVVRITGRQFSWEARYAGKDGEWDTKDDVVSFNKIVVPVHSKIVYELQSADVLHSLWIPNLRLKQDAVPGRTIKGWFEATKEGTYPVMCAELCGAGHGIMKGELQVVTRERFAEWLGNQQLALKGN